MTKWNARNLLAGAKKLEKNKTRKTFSPNWYNEDFLGTFYLPFEVSPNQTKSIKLILLFEKYLAGNAKGSEKYFRRWRNSGEAFK